MPKKTVTKAVAKTAKKNAAAGRPKGSGKFSCETKAVRIPTHLEKGVQGFIMKKIKTEK